MSITFRRKNKGEYTYTIAEGVSVEMAKLWVLRRYPDAEIIHVS